MVLQKNNQNERWLAVGLLLAVMGFISFVIILPLVNQGLALHEEKNALGFRFEQHERILARKQSVVDEMEMLKNQICRTKLFKYPKYQCVSVSRIAGND